MNKLGKTPVGLDCATVSLEEFVAVGDDNVCTSPITVDKYISSKKSLKNIINADYDDKNGCGNLVFKVTWPGCHAFKPSTAEDPPCRGAMHLTSFQSSNVLPFG
ncbi:hypothetical protein TNCV_4807981 [Trichonephila clavipes]|nr:hypothetical protein TNCV_4807981 [Trichonephila clavipes]